VESQTSHIGMIAKKRGICDAVNHSECEVSNTKTRHEHEFYELVAAEAVNSLETAAVT